MSSEKTKKGGGHTDSFDPTGALRSDEYALEPPLRRRPEGRSARSLCYEQMFCYDKITCGEGGAFKAAFPGSAGRPFPGKGGGAASGEKDAGGDE